MLRMRVLCRRCHIDQVMKSDTTTGLICNTPTHLMAFLQFLYSTFMTSHLHCVILRGSRSMS
jgi:hypothetical protein